MEGSEYYSTVAQSAIDIITPVLEESIVLSGVYSRACGRDTILGKDIEYCMKYCAMHSVGKTIGSHFPEIYETDEDSDESDIEIVNDVEHTFMAYSGANVQMNWINQAYNTWDDWKPTNPSEEMLKKSIDDTLGKLDEAE